MASVTVGNTTYRSFDDLPFAVNPGTHDAFVEFQPTDDPFFYDFFDRQTPTITLGAELRWESEKEQGVTDLSLADWISTRSADERFDVAFSPPWEEVRSPMYVRVRRVRTCRGLLLDRAGE